jgi:hypothetical protein
MQQWEVSISNINQIYEAIPCNGKAMSKAMGMISNNDLG